MPHRTRPMAGLLVFMGVSLVLVTTISTVYDFVCFLPYWKRRWRIPSEGTQSSASEGLS
ncbi:hypothetical protein ACP70R_021589 [Stipagrostis hirtigluma subsp. patula]